MNLKEIIQSENKLFKEVSNLRKGFKVRLTLNEAKKAWMSIGMRLAHPTTYKIDDTNKATVIEILKWAIMDNSCKYDLNKGLWLAGDIGTGKTLMIQILIELFRYSDKIIAPYSAIEIVELFRSGLPRERIFISPLFIDDLGAEEPEVKVFGNVYKPLYEILNRRYMSKRFLMFITTNLAPTQIEKRYGDRFRDRINEMFNVVKLTGKSRRK